MDYLKIKHIFKIDRIKWGKDKIRCHKIGQQRIVESKVSDMLLSRNCFKDFYKVSGGCWPAEAWVILTAKFQSHL